MKDCISKPVDETPLSGKIIGLLHKVQVVK